MGQRQRRSEHSRPKAKKIGAVMSKARKDPQKRKLREKAVRQRVLERREEIRAERKAMREELIKDIEMQQLEHGKVQQLLPGNPDAAERKLAEREQKVVSKLKKNLEILKELETEYNREQASRKTVNEQLEAEGFKTIKDKMDALQKKLHQYATENLDPSSVEGLPEPNSDVKQEISDNIENDVVKQS